MRFRWTGFDVRDLLPPRWKEELVRIALQHNTPKDLRPPHVTSREEGHLGPLSVEGVGSRVLEAEAPWLAALYRKEFLELAQSTTTEPAIHATGERHTIVINLQRHGGGRYECHVDTNPIQGMLYVTDHGVGDGGELLVANNMEARNVEEVDEDCIVIRPTSGHLLFFDARLHPHYMRPVLTPGAVRVAVGMNYYTASAPETQRPPDLDDYLAGLV